VLAALSPNAVSFSVADLLRDYTRYGEQIKPHVADTTRLLLDGLRERKRILFEAAQGSLLDVDHGTYPYVTSSNSSVAGTWSGSGVPARKLSRVIGVVKAYATRVGNGPFPTELNDGPTGLGQRIRDSGREYGTVTGRPRRCGWFDAVAVRYSAAISGADELAVMLLDVLTVVPEISVCTAYMLDNERLGYFPSDAYVLDRCRPVYETLPGWQTDLSKARRLADLPSAARRYLDKLEALLGLPVKIVSVGPDREQTIFT
jgi:adenylosuccinate synthase